MIEFTIDGVGIEAEEGSRAHLLKTLIVGHLAGGPIGSPQVIEQVWHHDKEDGMATLEPVIGDGCGQMGLATAESSLQHQPPLSLLRKVPGLIRGSLEAGLLLFGQPKASLGHKTLESHVGESAQIADLSERREAFGL